MASVKYEFESRYNRHTSIGAKTYCNDCGVECLLSDTLCMVCINAIAGIGKEAEIKYPRCHACLHKFKLAMREEYRLETTLLGDAAKYEVKFSKKFYEGMPPHIAKRIFQDFRSMPGFWLHLASQTPMKIDYIVSSIWSGRYEFNMARYLDEEDPTTVVFKIGKLIKAV